MQPDLEPAHISEQRVFGADAERCARTGRIFETGSGALPREQQTARFLREAATAADMPAEGERCPETGLPFEVGRGALTRARQTALFKASLEDPEWRAALQRDDKFTWALVPEKYKGGT